MPSNFRCSSSSDPNPTRPVLPSGNVHPPPLCSPAALLQLCCYVSCRSTGHPWLDDLGCCQSRLTGRCITSQSLGPKQMVWWSTPFLQVYYCSLLHDFLCNFTFYKKKYGCHWRTFSFPVLPESVCQNLENLSRTFSAKKKKNLIQLKKCKSSHGLTYQLKAYTSVLFLSTWWRCTDLKEIWKHVYYLIFLFFQNKQLIKTKHPGGYTQGKTEFEFCE